MGDERNSTELRRYAADVFGQAFDEHAILREERQSIDELLGTAIIQTHVAPQPNLAERVDPARYPDAESYLQAQHELFFGAPIEGDFHAVDWRIALAEKLRGHLMFVNLLRTLADGPLPLPAVAARMRTSLPLSADGVQAEREAVGLLNGLCALISAAREDDGAGGAKPFLSVGLHLWVRELRRMVCRVASTGVETASAMLRHSDDLNPEDSALHLPLVQCRECRVTGWGAVQRAASSQVGRDLREFYNRFFSRDMDVRFYFPAEGKQPPAWRAGTWRYAATAATSTPGTAPRTPPAQAAAKASRCPRSVRKRSPPAPAAPSSAATAPSATPAKRSSSSGHGRPACSAWCLARPSPPATTTMPAAKRNQRRTASPRAPRR